MSRRIQRNTEPAHEVINVTPALAEKWLGRNGHNRNLRQAKVEQYARDMSGGKWHFNGDAVRFDVGGELLDGQHRLHAISRSGTTQQMLIVYNLPVEAQDTMDIGARRSMGDQLQLSDEKNAHMLAAILKMVIAYERGIRWSQNYTATHAEMREYLIAHPEVRRAAEVASRGRKYVPCPPSVFGAAYHVCASRDREWAELFFVEQLTDNIGLKINDPARALHKFLSTARAERRQLSADETLRYIFLGWNHFRTGKRITKIQAPKGGWTAQNFPEPK